MIDVIKKRRYGVLFTAQTEAGLKACMDRYYALPRSRRRGMRVVTPSTIWRAINNKEKWQ